MTEPDLAARPSAGRSIGPSAYDVVIRNGTVLDGTGVDGVVADVAFKDGVIAALGDINGTGRQELDAEGQLVLPGFVDVHTHYDGQATWESRLVPSAWHGVTTVVMGNCGVGFAPSRSGDEDRLVQLMEGVEDIPGTALHEGLSWEWTSFAEFLDAVARRPHDVDIAAMLPHSALRFFVLGAGALDGSPATPDQIGEMARLTREAVDDGAIGFSTSRTRAHRSANGERIPSYSAEAHELVALALAMGGTGRGVFQLVSDYVPLDDEFDLLERIVRESGRPLSFSLAQSPPAPELYRQLLDRLAAAREQGLPITAQVAPRGVGMFLGLDTTLNPFSLYPLYQSIEHLPLLERAAVLRRDDVRWALLESATGEKDDLKVGGRLLERFDRMYEFSGPADYEPAPERSLAARAAQEGQRPEEIALDILSDGDGSNLIYLFLLNFVDGSLDTVREMLTHPYTVPGLGDGGAHVSTICDASFPTTLLTHWGRDRTRGRIPLPFLVQRQTSATARMVGLLDRGVVAPGYRADVNVVDYERLAVERPTIVRDLPAGGRRILQGAVGYRHTFVGGVETYREGEPTGALPGVVLRGKRPAPLTHSPITDSRRV